MSSDVVPEQVAPVMHVLIGVLPHFRVGAAAIADNIDLGHGVLLGRVDADMRTERICSRLSEHHRSLVMTARYAFRVSYEATRRPAPHPNEPPGTPEDLAWHKLLMCQVAMWIAVPADLSFEPGLLLVQHSGSAWDLVGRAHDIPMFIPPRDNGGPYPRYDTCDLELVKQLNAAQLRYPSSVWIARNLVSRALREDWWEIRYLLLWTALEALFGPRSPQESTYRLAYRMSLFFSENTAKARALFKWIKGRGYDLRSKVVHGMRPQRLTDEQSQSYMHQTEELVRSAMKRILLNADLIEIFSDEDRRDEYLEDRVFGG